MNWSQFNQGNGPIRDFIYPIGNNKINLVVRTLVKYEEYPVVRKLIRFVLYKIRINKTVSPITIKASLVVIRLTLKYFNTYVKKSMWDYIYSLY